VDDAVGKTVAWRSAGRGLVINKKRIFLFRTKTNIRQEKSAEYSADSEYSAQAGNIAKVYFCIRKKLVFWGGSCELQLMGMVYGQPKHTCIKH
jgi:hypothetical protein